MAEAFKSKLAAAQSENDDEAVTTIASSLRSLGLDGPVVAGTSDLHEEEYHRKLAKELGAVLLGSTSAGSAEALMAEGDPKRELIGLDEVWCSWNRARGVGAYSVLSRSVCLLMSKLLFASQQPSCLLKICAMPCTTCPALRYLK